MEERRRSYDAEPSAKLWETFVASAYQAPSLRPATIGWTSDIKQLSRTKAEGFLKRYYAPNNAVIAVVGDIQSSQRSSDWWNAISVPFPPVQRCRRCCPVRRRAQRGGERRVEVRGDAEPGW